jgi:hypothetical protein
MTVELQHAMAQYEEARARYRSAVLASLNGESNGDAIRAAIQSFQLARAELARHDGRATAAPAPVREEPGPWGFVRRLLKAS